MGAKSESGVKIFIQAIGRDFDKFSKRCCLIKVVYSVRIFSDDIKMDFGLSKCAVLIMKRGKVVTRDGIDLPYGKMMKCIEEGSGYKYLGILEADGIKHEEMKDQVTKEYVRRFRTILKSKLNGGNIISAINSLSIIRYGAGIIGWTQAELQALDRKTRKMSTIYGAHHPKADVDRMYLRRAEGGRCLIGVEGCVRIEIDSLEKDLQNSTEELLMAVNRNDAFGVNKCGKGKEEVQKEHETAYKEKTLHGQFRKVTDDIRGGKTWDWLKKGYLKKRDREYNHSSARSGIMQKQHEESSVWRRHVSTMSNVWYGR